MSMSKSEEFFNDEELSKHFKFRIDLLPTKTDCLLYVVSRTRKIKNGKDQVTHEVAVRQPASTVES